MIMECLWCDTEIPRSAEIVLCQSCRGDGKLHRCWNTEHLPTWGSPNCGQCASDAYRLRLLRLRRQDMLAQLRRIRADLVREWREPWPGAEHGKVLIGRSLDGAIEEVERILGER